MISIVGGGPIGSYTAYLLASKGKDVNVYEEHDKIGLPVQCTGLVTEELAKIIRISNKFLINEVDSANIYAPSGKFINIKFKNKNLILDRNIFDKYLAEKAEGAGAKYFLGHKFLGFKNNTLKFNKGLKKTNILIGADGPFSNVAKSCGLFGNRKFAVGLQARMNLNDDRNLIKFYLNENYFGWAVPENENISRVGIVARKSPGLCFKKFIANLGRHKIREYQSGLIPIHNPNAKAQYRNIFLVGDAALQVKASTFGGIIPGLKAAEELSKAIIHKKNYEILWRKRIGKELKLHLKIRKVLDKFNRNDYENLIKLVDKDKIKNLLSNYNRDSISKVGLKLILKEPRLLKFLFK